MSNEINNEKIEEENRIEKNVLYGIVKSKIRTFV